jgi:hypothetical protein
MRGKKNRRALDVPAEEWTIMYGLLDSKSMSLRAIANMYHINKDVLHNRSRNRDTIAAASGRPPVLSAVVEETLAHACRTSHAAGCGYTRAEIQAAAVGIAQDCGITGFTASNMWLDGFRSRHKLKAKRGE